MKRFTGSLPGPRPYCGASLADPPRRQMRGLAVQTLHRALVARESTPGIIHHFDGRSQHRCAACQTWVRKRNFPISITGRGDDFDNPMVKRCVLTRTDGVHRSTFEIIKPELIWPFSGELIRWIDPLSVSPWQSRQQAEDAVARSIDGFYDTAWLYPPNGLQSPSPSPELPRS